MMVERKVTIDTDPSFVITHRMSLDDAPRGYEMFRKQAGRLREDRPLP